VCSSDLKGGVGAFSGPIGNRIAASQIQRERREKTKKIKQKINK
jgi:hypothetical protein